MESGDLVCLLMGCSAPVILRKQVDNSYAFIGDCIFSEFMNGECMDGVKDGKYTLQSFCMDRALIMDHTFKPYRGAGRGVYQRDGRVFKQIRLR